MLSKDETPCCHGPLSPAVQRCCDARNRILIENILIGSPEKPTSYTLSTNMLPEFISAAQVGYHARQAAATAYRNAMPDPSTRQNIRDYIACVLHGMTVNAIRDDEGARLLSGAKIALAANRKTPRVREQKANAERLNSDEPQINAA